MIFTKEAIQSEVTFRTSRSSGAGGQNVNKVSTRVEALWNYDQSSLLNEEQKQIISEKLKGRINSEGTLIVSCEETRSQLDNKERAIKKLMMLIEKAFFKPKPRKKTKVSKLTKAINKANKQYISKLKKERSFKGMKE
jgi:ribosome-associated protein